MMLPDSRKESMAYGKAMKKKKVPAGMKPMRGRKKK
jgi:hypothetical protein|tara:strand:+ start:956 stop:1063 length:108 start_codon:yes stop_codon:yes gene_type:complete